MCAGSLVAAAPCAAADPEEIPYSIGAGLGFALDDNLFRAPGGHEISDRHVIGSLFGTVDRSVGRQRVQASATVQDNRYRSRHDLDNTGYDAKLGWTGATEGDLSWTLSHEATRQLASYATVLNPQFTGVNVQTIDQTLAGMQLGLQAKWVANLGLSHRRVDDTADAFASERVQLDTLGAGAQWNPLGPLSASLGPRYTRGRVPAGAGEPARSFQRRDLDFGLGWTVSGASVLHSRLSVTRQSRDSLGLGDYNGTTGQVDWQWTATGRTRVGVWLSRETGSESSFFAPAGSGSSLRGIGDDSQLTTALAARVDHDLTGKVSLSLDAQFARRQLASTTATAGADAQAGSDRSTLLRIGLRYAPTRSVALSCDAGREHRTSNTPLSSPYRVATASCSAQITLRWT